MKRFLALILAFTTLLLSGCIVEEDPIEHVHIFDIKTTNEHTHATDATCTARPTYYFSCRCGEISTTTFEYGDTIAHTYGQNTDKTYLKSAYDCTKQSEYWHACTVCGAKGTTTFFHGEVKEHSPNQCETYCVDCGWYKEHVYDQESTDAKYIKGKYDCTKQNEYYHSCVCGAKGTTTFLADESTVTTHTYTADCDTFCDVCGAQRKAPANHGELDGYTCTVCGTEPRQENWTDWDDFT